MVKEMIVSLVVVVSIITINFFLQSYTENSINHMVNNLNELRKELLKGEEQEIKNKVSNIKEEWKKINHNMAFYIEHDELEKVKTDLVSLEGFIEVKDYETGVSELNKSIYVLEHIADKYDFNLINIF